MTSQQLTCFLKLAEIQHFTEAAEELFISQASLSYAIHTLEEEIGASLFIRGARKTELSAYGRSFLPYAKTAYDALAEGKEKLSRSSKTASGVVRISYSPSIGYSKIPTFVQRFYSNKQNGGIILDLIRSSTSSEMIERMKSGDADLIFCYDTNKDMISHPVFSHDLVLALSDTHRLASKNYIDLSDIENEPFVIGSKDGFIYERLLKQFAHSKKKPNVVMTNDDLWAQLSFVSAGFGIALVPEVACNIPHLVYRHINHPFRHIQISLSHLSEQALRPEVKYVWDFIIRYSSDLYPGEDI